MTDWGVTQFGFRRKTYADIIADMESKAKNLLGANIDLSSASPLALFLRVIAFGLSLLWAVAERVYNSAFVDHAVGQSLDYVVKYAGIARRSATAARRMVRFTGDPGVVIPAGFLIGTDDLSIRFATAETVTIPESGQVDILTHAVEPGTSSNVSTGQLNRVINPIAGIDAVTNIDHPRNVDGLDRETDRELRERYVLSLAAGGASTIDSIRASVLAVRGVRTANVFANRTMETDDDGRPPKSVEVIVLGGSDEDVARAILNTIAAGIEPFGDVEVPIEDAGGQEQLIRFNRAQVIDIYVNIEVETSAAYPADGDDRVRDAVIAYIGGVDTEGVTNAGLSLGQHVVWTAVIQAARSVPGVIDVSVTIGTEPNPTSTSNIPVGARQVAETAHDKVVVSHA